jgi:UDP-N-acetylmuramate dehydrogenase
VEGLVIKVSLQGKEVIKKEKNQIFVRVAAGEDWSSFVEYANAQGRAGIENLIAIPGNVGTAPFSNIGAYGMEVSKVIAQVEGYDLSTGEKKLFSHAECQFSYRNSIFKSHLKNQFLITHVVFVLQQFDENYQFVTDYSDIQALLSTSASLAEQDDGHLTLPQMSKMIAEIRAKKLPDVKKVGTVGSFFVNPLLCMQHFEALKKEYPTIPSYPVDQEVVKVPAAWLIEQCGLKGYINGKAGTSPDHALIVVNY